MGINKKIIETEAAPSLPDFEFDVKSYTGNGSTNSITGLGFAPDAIWLKDRNTAYPHYIYDTVRGPLKGLRPSNSDAESTNLGVSSFDSDGFTLDSNAGANQSGSPNIAWAWKANGNLPTINTDGSINSIVSANTNAGFSIVKYTGNETAGQTVGHGLSAAPEIAFIKQLDGTREWQVPLFTQTSGNYLKLNATAAKATDTTRWSAVSSTTFTIGAQPHTNGTGSPYIAYCFHSVSGFSKIGSYTGTGSSGNAQNIGFQPNLIIIKSTSNSAANWQMYDSVRGANKRLYPNLSNAEYTDSTSVINFLSDGFDFNSGDSHNNGSHNYIYMAFKIN